MRASFLVLIWAAAAAAQDAVTPGELLIEMPTLENLGFEWKIAGDENRNAAVRVRYRKRGAAVREAAVRTRPVPGEWAGGRIRHVYPKRWKGTRQAPAS